mgnify:CR=1 FL=1|tara:strand:+ start:1437 stop:2084 length:648 start_codon:yes stop_codon:yes gene_type:complete
MRLAPEGNIIVYPVFFILLISFGSDFIFSTKYLVFLNIFLLVVFIFCLNFFRDPKRNLPADENCIVSPADGKIIKIKEFEDPVTKEKLRLVSIFLSVFNVHSNRMPVNGTIKSVEYIKGDFLAAFDHKASEENERTEIFIETIFGSMIVKQIAGLVARRILCYAKENEKMLAGDRLGFIRFGSRTDIILPHKVTLNIELNQKVYGGQTIIGKYEV